MRYLLLINKNEARYRALSDDERRALHARYEAYGRKMMAAGVLKEGAMLELTETATTVRIRDGKRVLTDGPFAEMTEQIAGIGIIEVTNLDEALKWAAGHPDAEWASVEVRPIVPWEHKE
jgi:hypothetical protein